MDIFPVEGGYRSVNICRSRKLLGNIVPTASAFSFFISKPLLHRISHRQYISSCWYPLGWNWGFSTGLENDVVEFRDYHAHAQHLEQPPGVIDTASIIEGINSWCIMRKVTITAKGLFSIWLSFCTVFFPRDVHICFGFTPIINCAV